MTEDKKISDRNTYIALLRIQFKNIFEDDDATSKKNILKHYDSQNYLN